MKKNYYAEMYMSSRIGHPFFSKERNALAFFSVLYKKKLNDLCILLGLISRQKLQNRTEKNVAFFKRTEKNGMF